MAKKSGIKFNPKGFEQLRHDPRVEQYLLAMAKRIAAAAGGESMGFKVTELVLEDPRSAVSVMLTAYDRVNAINNSEACVEGSGA